MRDGKFGRSAGSTRREASSNISVVTGKGRCSRRQAADCSWEGESLDGEQQISTELWREWPWGLGPSGSQIASSLVLNGVALPKTDTTQDLGVL